jgi:hypothetical protein
MSSNEKAPLWDSPLACYDVIIPDNGIEHVYRVAFFGGLDEEWMADYRNGFYQIHSLEDHAANIAKKHADGNVATFVDGYGKKTYIEHNWNKISVIMSTGEAVGVILVKLWNAKHLTKKVDVTEIAEVEWNGLKNT